MYKQLLSFDVRYKITLCISYVSRRLIVIDLNRYQKIAIKIYTRTYLCLTMDTI